MTIGATLAAARESAGLSLQDVSDRTRIRSAVIAAIEADDFRLCGGDVYARGHVQSLARTSGIDPTPLLAEFDALHPRDNAPSPTELADLDNRDIRDGWTPNWGAAVAAVLVLLVSFGVVRFITADSGGGRQPTTIAESSSTSSPRPSTSTSSSEAPPSPSASPSGSVVAQAPQTVKVKVSVAEACWMRVESRGEKLYEGTMQPGDSQIFTDKKEVKLLLGNAGGVSLVVNGKDLGVPGGRGEIVRLAFTPGDPTLG